ncbi:MAG: AlpA family phage regulatory protein [Pseudomonadota bacterium]|nr:AlpA family phage regulatory protein [Pseudomonadota bacterium]MDQ6867245.1 AlpA family phage regulatory protein [Pseudomonadota bacterium]
MENPLLTKERTSCRAARLPRVRDITRLSSATIWRKDKYDPSFPRSFKLSKGVTCWDENEILAWIESKKAERGAL